MSGTIIASAGAEGYQLFLGVNDTNPPDNSGAFAANVVETTVPEPASLLLLGTGLIGLARARRRRGN